MLREIKEADFFCGGGLKILNGVGNPGQTVRAGDETNLRRIGEKFRPELLGYAADDSHDNSRIVSCLLADSAEHASNLELRLFADRTRVDDNDGRAVQTAFGESSGSESPGQPSRIVDVHLAAEGDDMKNLSLHVCLIRAGGRERRLPRNYCFLLVVTSESRDCMGSLFMESMRSS